MATYEIQPNTEATPIVYKNGLVSLYVKFIKDDLTESAVQYYEVSTGTANAEDLDVDYVKTALQHASDLYNTQSTVSESQESEFITDLLN